MEAKPHMDGPVDVSSKDGDFSEPARWLLVMNKRGPNVLGGWSFTHSFIHACMHARIHSLHECELQHSVNRNDDIMLLWGVIMYQHRIGLFRVFLWNKAPVKVMIWVSFSDETWNYNGKKYWEPISLRNSTHAVVLLQIYIYIYIYISFLNNN